MAQMTGKTVLVTGATSGIGKEAAAALAKQGAEVVIVGRDRTRTDEALAEIQQRSGSQRVSALLCDFSSQQQIRRLAQALRAQHDRLDVLVNNAGLVAPTRTVTEDGVETTFAVNHLGYFLLTSLLLDLLEKSAPARIVNVASAGHHQGTMDFADLGFERGGYSEYAAYARSKLANVLFTTELARRLEGKGVTVNALHPGVVATGIWSKLKPWQRALLAPAKLFFRTPEKGAETIVFLASSPKAEGVTGKYFVDCKEARTSRVAQDPEVAKRLWVVSEGLVGKSAA